jgi:hypothetical protein
MSDSDERLREALERIAELASAAINGEDAHHHGEDEPERDSAGEARVCTPKSLPKRLAIRAAENATRINPVNAPMLASYSLGAAVPSDPLAIAVLTAKYFGPSPRRLTVSFMESTPADLRARIVSHLNAWTRTGCISFVETGGTGQVRISRGPGGYWSYLGTDIMLIPRNRPTMNLQGFTMSTPDSEYRRVIRHEAGHTLGFPHEHMRKALVDRIDREKAYAYFLRTQGWNRQQVDQQVLTPLSEQSIMATPADQTSIMCYQLPGSITKDGQPVLGGRDINATDYAFVGQIYPRPGLAYAGDETEDWDESDDVSEFGEAAE